MAAYKWNCSAFECAGDKGPVKEDGGAHSMKYVTHSVNRFDNSVADYLEKLNGSLTNELTFVVKKAQSSEILLYDSSVVQCVMYSTNFACYLFFVVSQDDEMKVTFVDCFDVVGDVR